MDERYDKGLATRRRVLGNEAVEAALRAATDFTHPLQEHMTKAAWGEMWQREGLDDRTRSLVTIAMLTALGRTAQIKGHVRGALNNGATVREIQEVLMHSTIYCGVPAAVDAFTVADAAIQTLAP